MAQDERQVEEADPSSGRDLVTLYSSLTVDSEIEADVIRGLLDSNGIPSLLAGTNIYPNLGFEVKVPREMLEEARRVIADALASGPEAASEAEAASEGQPPGLA